MFSLICALNGWVNNREAGYIYVVKPILIYTNTLLDRGTFRECLAWWILQHYSQESRNYVRKHPSYLNFLYWENPKCMAWMLSTSRWKHCCLVTNIDAREMLFLMSLYVSQIRFSQTKIWGFIKIYQLSRGCSRLKSPEVLALLTSLSFMSQLFFGQSIGPLTGQLVILWCISKGV